MVEMTEAAHILRNATDQSLVLMDEIGRGTSTYDGLSLAWACAEHLAENNRALCLFATHYFELTDMIAHHPSVENVHLDAVEHDGKIIFLHRIKTGATDKSYGLQVAQLAGVPDIALGYAKERLAKLELSSHQSQLAQSGSSTVPHTPAARNATVQADDRAPTTPTLNTTSEAVTEDLSSAASMQKPKAQLDLFSHSEMLADYLKRLDLDGITAREALSHLYKMADLLPGDQRPDQPQSNSGKHVS
jgi:DNA mismatch repair protein MutS